MILANFGFFTKFYFIFLHENLTFSPKFKIMAERKPTISTCVSDIDVNSCASESLRPQLLHAQEFKSKSRTIVSKPSIGSSAVFKCF